MCVPSTLQTYSIAVHVPYLTHDGRSLSVTRNDLPLGTLPSLSHPESPAVAHGPHITLSHFDVPTTFPSRCPGLPRGLGVFRPLSHRPGTPPAPFLPHTFLLIPSLPSFTSLPSSLLLLPPYPPCQGRLAWSLRGDEVL